MTLVVGRHVSKLFGYAPAVPTPFDDDGNIGRAAFATYCERQIGKGAPHLLCAEQRAKHLRCVRQSITSSSALPLTSRAVGFRSSRAQAPTRRRTLLSLQKMQKQAAPMPSSRSCRTTT